MVSSASYSIDTEGEALIEKDKIKFSPCSSWVARLQARLGQLPQTCILGENLSYNVGLAAAVLNRT